MRRLVCLLLLALMRIDASAEPLVGVDHIPLAVRDLDQAVRDFQHLGFAIKPGRPHANGLRNAHIKFVDGAGLELITADGAQDALSSLYVEHLRQGDGPVFLSFHARDLGRLEAELTAARLPYERKGAMLSFKDPALARFFVIADNRSPTDRPDHFAHANGARATREVWLATDDLAPLQRMFEAMGAKVSEADAETTVFELQDSRVVVRPARHQRVPGRPIVGVVMAAPLAATIRAGRIKAEAAHGLWIVLRREP